MSLASKNQVHGICTRWLCPELLGRACAHLSMCSIKWTEGHAAAAHLSMRSAGKELMTDRAPNIPWLMVQKNSTGWRRAMDDWLLPVKRKQGGSSGIIWPFNDAGSAQLSSHNALLRTAIDKRLHHHQRDQQALSCCFLT